MSSIDEVNVLILIDVSGSMLDEHQTGKSKLETALERAKEKVLERVTAFKTSGSPYQNKPLEFALWAFDSNFPEADGFVKKILNFPSTADAVLSKLGYTSTGDPSPATRDASLVPMGATPLGAAGCAAATNLVASLTDTGGVQTAGYEWQKQIGSPPRLSNIERRLVLETDGLENATPDGNECGGTTSTKDYELFEEDSWQYKLRNKLLTGNPTRTSTLKSGLVVDVDLIFTNFVTGLGRGSEANYTTGTPYTSEPTLAQALEFYGGVADNTRGKFKTVTVAKNGKIDARRPGDVDYSNCVGQADYSEMMQFYGQAVSANQPHSYWADLNGDGWVDFLDYLILTEHWGDGGVC
jgi:hypothetical protein